MFCNHNSRLWSFCTIFGAVADADLTEYLRTLLSLMTYLNFNFTFRFRKEAPDWNEMTRFFRFFTQWFFFFLSIENIECSCWGQLWFILVMILTSIYWLRSHMAHPKLNDRICYLNKNILFLDFHQIHQAFVFISAVRPIYCWRHKSTAPKVNWIFDSEPKCEMKQSFSFLS